MEQAPLTRWKSGVPSRSELRDAKREAVLREASASFNTRGYHGTSLEEIAQRLGVTKPALYYYFPNKQAVLKACLDSAMEVAFENIARARREGRTGRERLRIALSDMLDYFLDEHCVSITMIEEGSLPAEEFRSVMAKRRQFEHALRDFVREGIEDGSVIACDPKLVVFALLGAVNWVPRWHRADGAWSRAQINARLTDVLERMISSEPAATLSPPL